MRNTLYNHVAARIAVPVAVYTDTVTGTTVDLGVFGNDFRTVMFVVHAGTVEDGTYTVTLEHSATGSGDWAAVPADRRQGTLPVVDSAHSDTVYEFGYIVGTQRYVRLVVTEATATDGATFGAVALCGMPGSTPVARS